VTLRLDQLAVTVAGRQLLPPTDLRVPAGAMLAVVGASGSGKTSVLGTLAGLAAPTAGGAYLDDRRVADMDRREIGVVTQPVILAATLTVEENISLPLLATGLSDDDIDDKAGEILHQLHLGGLADRLPAQLSGGQLQRVATARAVVGAARLIVADEPTSELDEDNRERVLDALRLSASRGATVVIATHDEDLANACSHSLTLGG
jgi:putative ABC transport system ATP-binding protein